MIDQFESRIDYIFVRKFRKKITITFNYQVYGRLYLENFDSQPGSTRRLQRLLSFSNWRIRTLLSSYITLAEA